MSKNKKKFENNILSYFAFSIFVICFLFVSGCSKKDLSDDDRPLQAEDKRKRNVKEGRGVSLGGLVKNRMNSTNYEFSTSNPMWRASLETLDFLPLTTVDYSGGMIITDWYSDDSAGDNDSIKISLRFLGNDIRSESLKVIVHKKACTSNNNCKVSLLSNTKIKDELHSTILKKASLLEKQSKEKK